MRCFRTFAFLLALGGCARQTTPNGGPKDTTPPKLVRSNPANNEANFSDKTLTLTFDEAVKLKSPKEEIIIAPYPGKDITFLAKGNRVTIEFKNKLADSTTYSLNFRDGIQDLTEGNAPDNLRLAFSTGPVVDSLSISGNIKDAKTEKIPDKITVAIFSSDTFNMFKHTPQYLTKSNKKGKFTISNLKPGKYKIYAFDDKNKNLKMETKSESFGFIPGKIDLTQSIDTILIPMVSLDSRPIVFSNIRNQQLISIAKFNKYLTSYEASSPPPPLLSTFGDDQTEIKIYHHDPLTDSVPFSIHANDSLEQSLDTAVYVRTGKGTSTPDAFKPSVTDASFNRDSSTFNALLTLGKPLRTVNLDSIYLKFDSLHIIPITKSNLFYDTAFKRIRFKLNVPRRLLDSAKADANFIIAAKSFITIDNDTSKAMTKSINILKAEDMATLFLTVVTNKTHFLVQLLTPDYKLVQQIADHKDIAFRNVPPGEFKIRVVHDVNQNGQWDPGNINRDIPPEETFFYKNADGKFQFPLRANWEVGGYTISF